MKFMQDFSAQINKLKEELQNADAIVIGAGAGLSTSAAMICFFVWRPAGGAGDADIYVESVAAILEYQTDSPGMFAGKVESQEILEIRNAFVCI